MNRLKLLALLLVSACAGKDGAVGPTGPAGSQGPQGPQGIQGLPGPAGANGSANFYRAFATVGANGSASVALPASAGSSAALPPPLMSCYLSTSTNSGAYVQIAGTSTTNYPYCGLTFSGGVWNAVTSQAPVGWVAVWIVTW